MKELEPIQVRLDLKDNDIAEEDESFVIPWPRCWRWPSTVGSATFTIFDDDTRGLEVFASSIETERPEGRLVLYQVELTSRPIVDVTVDISATDPEGVSISLSIMQMTFTPANWEYGQILTVTLKDNDHIQQRRTPVTINFVASGGDYAGLRTSGTIVVIDDEPERTTITLSLLDENMQKLEQLEVEEGGPVRVYVAAETSTTLYVDVPIALIYGAGTAGDYRLTPCWRFSAYPGR